MIFVLNRLCTLFSSVIRSQSRHISPLGHTQVIKMSTCKSTVGDQSDIVWMDLEMTGLDIDKDQILEVACIITDKHLNIKAEGPCFAIRHAPQVYNNMNEWCIKHHNESGLVDRCKESDVTPELAENLILSFLKQNIPERKCPLAGNSIYMDRLFLRKFYPAVDEYLHYRIIDVSTVKELATRWHPRVIQAAAHKKLAHRSLDDIKESIAELKYYKEHLFK
ncbi:probable oligoribonuclease [Drosophila novamexicana]|uniref:probable oligoribonuclease n=1 Tax=Drosophila novamexicana TaxID=47314 RepID=UPI0011E5B7F0|nr:probable oligoribonuclease [Drosophila novamexicana]